MHLSYLVKNLKIPTQLEIRLLIGSETRVLFYYQAKTSWNAILAHRSHTWDVTSCTVMMMWKWQCLCT